MQSAVHGSPLASNKLALHFVIVPGSRKHVKRNERSDDRAGPAGGSHTAVIAKIQYSSTILQVAVGYGGNHHEIDKSSEQMASGALDSLVWSSRSADHGRVACQAACSGARGSSGRGAIHFG